MKNLLFLFNIFLLLYFLMYGVNCSILNYMSDYEIDKIFNDKINYTKEEEIYILNYIIKKNV